jgi:hypothetical protein
MHISLEVKPVLAAATVVGGFATLAGIAKLIRQYILVPKLTGLNDILGLKAPRTDNRIKVRAVIRGGR